MYHTTLMNAIRKKYKRMFGGVWMTPIQITLVILLVVVLVTILITYLVRNNYYKQIDDLDRQKSEVLQKAPYDELKEVSELNITGQSYEVRKKLEDQWRNIESVKYPKLENYLFDAEQATDRYHLIDSKKNQEAAEQSIKDINGEISELQSSLTELIEREQANLEMIDEIKKRYHEVRKSLLAYSFSFGPASESFEKKLRSMEDDFKQFSNFTVSGDHEEAKEIVNRLSDEIKHTEEQMEDVPPLLEKVDTDFKEQLEDLKSGYESMTDKGFLFPNDTILNDIEQLENEKEAIYENIRLLDLEKAKEAIENLADKIDSLYDRMEFEYHAKPEAEELLELSKKALYFLQEEHRNMNATVHRIGQSYILNHEEADRVEELGEQVKEAREEYNVLDDRMKHQALPYSVAYDELHQLFNHLDHLNDQYRKIAANLENYRTQEMTYKEDLAEIEQKMYRIKRRVENERLPGLSDDYLELFFSTTDRLEHFGHELARPRIQLIDIEKWHQNVKEDIEQLEKMTNETIHQVNLVERTSQRLYRYKDSHKGILETIRYSESLFTEDYDYETALKLVREKLENVAPGDYAEVETAYYNEVEAEETVEVE